MPDCLFDVAGPLEKTPVRRAPDLLLTETFRVSGRAAACRCAGPDRACGPDAPCDTGGAATPGATSPAGPETGLVSGQ